MNFLTQSIIYADTAIQIPTKTPITGNFALYWQVLQSVFSGQIIHLDESALPCVDAIVITDNEIIIKRRM